jgi:hypothetical protein
LEQNARIAKLLLFIRYEKYRKSAVGASSYIITELSRNQLGGKVS